MIQILDIQILAINVYTHFINIYVLVIEVLIISNFMNFNKKLLHYER
jgi:hypothetical protein